MPALPIMTGLLTIAVLVLVGVSLLSSGQTTFGAIVLALGALRALLMAGHIWRRRQELED
jgi:hypothetical protein